MMAVEFINTQGAEGGMGGFGALGERASGSFSVENGRKPRQLSGNA